MRQLRQMLRLAEEDLSPAEIGHRLGVARSTVQGNLARTREAGLCWPLPGELNDDVLAGRLFVRSGALSGARPPPGAELLRPRR